MFDNIWDFYLNDPVDFSTAIIRIFRVLFCLTFYIFLSACNHQQIFTKKAENGFLDLSQWNHSKQSIIAIKGGANFYWQRFISMDSMNNTEKPDCVISLKKSWNSQKDQNCKFPAIGFATYHIQITLPKHLIGKQISIYPKHFIAYTSKFFIDKQIVGFSGNISNHKDENYKPSRNFNSIPFVIKNQNINLFIHVANFHHYRSGIYNPIYIGPTFNMQFFREKNILKDLIVIISLIIMFFYHQLLFFVSRKQVSNFYFSITCLFFAFDFSFYGTMTFFLLFPNLDHELVNRIVLSLHFSLLSTFLFFLYETLPEKTLKIIRIVAALVSMVLIGLTFSIGSSIYKNVAIPHAIYLFCLIVYMFFPILKAVKNNRDGSKIFLISYSIFFVFALNDILLLTEKIESTFLASAGMMIFIITLSIWQGLQQKKAQKKNNKLASELKILNQELEHPMLLSIQIQIQK